MQPVFPQTYKYEIWAKELANDLDRDFILNGIQEGFDLIQRDITV